ncbi:MAG TPA: hypothetical protein VEZ55_06915 [Chitinophagaceae bacterium]|nr:hypothetical protein [Chitinophagaceae bacterium]
MLTLHRKGKLEEWQLQQAARGYIGLYKKPGEETVLIPFRDVARNKVRYVKFQKFEGVEHWSFVDLVDNNA